MMWQKLYKFSARSDQFFCEKKAKNNFASFCNFAGFFLLFDPAKWPQNSNLTSSAQHHLAVPDLFDFTFCVWPLLPPRKCLLPIPTTDLLSRVCSCFFSGGTRIARTDGFANICFPAAAFSCLRGDLFHFAPTVFGSHQTPKLLFAGLS